MVYLSGSKIDPSKVYISRCPASERLGIDLQEYYHITFVITSMAHHIIPFTVNLWYTNFDVVQTQTMLQYLAPLKLLCLFPFLVIFFKVAYSKSKLQE